VVSVTKGHDKSCLVKHIFGFAYCVGRLTSRVVEDKCQVCVTLLLNEAIFFSSDNLKSHYNYESKFRMECVFIKLRLFIEMRLQYV